MIITTDLLASGDLIHIHGMIVELGGDPHTYTGNGGRQCHSWPDMPIISGVHPFVNGGDTWSIQGNALAMWRVQRPVVAS